MHWPNSTIPARSRRRHWRLVPVMLALLGSPWASPAGAANRFDQLRDQDLRVASISYRLSIASGFRCASALSPQLGFVLHGIEQYRLADRAEAAERYDLGAQVGVMAVVAGSPAEKAGLTAKDRLISVNGRDLPITTGSDGPPNRLMVVRAEQILSVEMSKGPVTLRISRRGVAKELHWPAERGCTTNVETVPGAAANAWADGKAVVVSAGILAACRDDNDLALVIAHEMGHNLLHHHQRLVSAGVQRRRFFPAPDDGSAMMRETEEEADRLAVGMATEAGYDLKGADMFLRSLMAQIDPTLVTATHPQLERRLGLLKEAIAAYVLAPRIGE